MLSSLHIVVASCILIRQDGPIVPGPHEPPGPHEHRFSNQRFLFEIRETMHHIYHIYHYEMHPICSLQRHHRLNKGVTITQALRCQVDIWLMGALRKKEADALREKSFGCNCHARG
jgi:hypothetical protein